MPLRLVDEITAAAAFTDIASSVVWAHVATVDTDGRPWTRVLHPLWVTGPEGLRGVVLTRPTPLKRRHLAAHPHLAVGYWHPDHRVATAQCAARWGDPAEVTSAWQVARTRTGPDGYDPADIWPAGPADPSCAALLLTPWRLTAATADQLAIGGGCQWISPAHHPMKGT